MASWIEFVRALFVNFLLDFAFAFSSALCTLACTFTREMGKEMRRRHTGPGVVASLLGTAKQPQPVPNIQNKQDLFSVDDAVNSAFSHSKSVKMWALLGGMSFAMTLVMSVASTNAFKLSDTVIDKDVAKGLVAGAGLLALLAFRKMNQNIAQFAGFRAALSALGERLHPVSKASQSSSIAVDMRPSDEETRSHPGRLYIAKDNQAWLQAMTPERLKKSALGHAAVGLVFTAALCSAALYLFVANDKADGDLGKDPAAYAAGLTVAVAAMFSPMLCWMVDRFQRMPMAQGIPAQRLAEVRAAMMPRLMGAAAASELAGGSGDVYVDMSQLDAKAVPSTVSPTSSPTAH